MHSQAHCSLVRPATLNVAVKRRELSMSTDYIITFQLHVVQLAAASGIVHRGRVERQTRRERDTESVDGDEEWGGSVSSPADWEVCPNVVRFPRGARGAA